MSAIVPLAAKEMSAVAPNWSAMRVAIAHCERVDEIKSISDKAVALRAYFAQTNDVENELGAMRVRLRAERRLGELIQAEQEAGRLAGRGQPKENSSATRLSDLGIPHDRSARAQKLASIPEDQFEAGLGVSRPSARSLAALAGSDSKKTDADVEQVLKTWGAIRDLALAVADGSMLSGRRLLDHPHVQAFQLREIRAALPGLLAYLCDLQEQLK
jgi:hypothetical protein